MAEIPLHLYYERSKRVVGRARNGAYVPHLIQKHLAHAIRREHGIELPRKLIEDAIYNIPITLYPDAQEFLGELGQDTSIVPLIFTQGEVGENGFQNWKIEKSKVSDYLNLDTIELLKNHNFPFIYGGYDKCTLEVIEPIIAFLDAAHIQQTVYIDDSMQNVEKIVELFRDFQRPIHGYWLNREQEVVTPASEPMFVVNSLSEIDISAYKGALAMIDYDGTLVDRKSIRAALKKSVISTLESYLQTI